MRVIYNGEDGDAVTVRNLTLVAGVPSGEMSEKRARALIAQRHLKIHEYVAPDVDPGVDPEDDETTGE